MADTTPEEIGVEIAITTDAAADTEDAGSGEPARLPPVGEQTELESSVAVNWKGEPRDRLRERVAEAARDGEEHGVALRAFDRRSTLVEVLTVEEAEAMLYWLDAYLHSVGHDWMTAARRRSFGRVASRFREGLEDAGWFVLDDEDAFGATLSTEAPERSSRPRVWER